MAALTGNTIASTYKQLLKLTSEGVGADASAKYIEDGLGTDTALSLSTTRVGIGTTAPENLLSLYSTGSTALEIRSGATTDAQDPHLLFRKSAGAGESDLTLVGEDDHLGTIRFDGADGNEFIQSAGIEGRIDVDGNTPANNVMPGKLLFNTNNNGAGVTTKMVIKYDGKVGIGTTAPDQLVTIEGNEGTDYASSSGSVSEPAGGVYLKIKNNSTDSEDHAGIKLYANPSTWYLATKRNSSGDYAMGANLVIGARTGATAYQQLMAISPTGNVGIGVADPSELLDVNGTVRAKALRIDEAANVNEGTITNTSVAGYSRLKASTNSGGGSTGVLIKGLDGGVEGQVLYIYKTSSNGILRIYNNSTNASAGDKILVPGCVADDDTDYITIPAGGYGGFTLVYDTSAAEAYWHLIASAPNAAVTA